MRAYNPRDTIADTGELAPTPDGAPIASPEAGGQAPGAYPEARSREDAELAQAESPEGGLGLPRQDRELLLARFGRPFVAGEALFREGEPAREALLLEDGRVRVLKRVRLVERSLRVLRPGDLFGESALLGDAARSSTALALTDGVAIAIDRASFRPLLERHPEIAARVVEQLVVRVRDAEDQIEVMMLRDTQSKIISSLLKLAQAASGAAALSVTPVELSTRVGLDVDTVKRAVGRLREQQYVRIVGERVEIPDVEALRRLYTLLGSKEELQGA